MIKWIIKRLNSIKNNKAAKTSKQRQSIKNQAKILNIYGSNFDTEEMQELASITGDKFHFLIRRVGDVAFRDDFGLSEEETFKKMIPKSNTFEFQYYEEKYIDGIRLNNGIEIGYSAEMVGIQVYIDDTITCQQATKYVQEITQNLLESTQKEAELWLVINESVISIPL